MIFDLSKIDLEEHKKYCEEKKLLRGIKKYKKEFGNKRKCPIKQIKT